MKISLLRKYIMTLENVHLKAYSSKADGVKAKKTIGVGFNLERDGAKKIIEDLGLNYKEVLKGKKSLTLTQVINLFDADLKAAFRDARAVIKNFDELSDTRQMILVDMAFNTGRQGLSEFKKMVNAIELKQWDKAAAEMKDSDWYKQVGRRARWGVEAMKTDVMPDFASETPDRAYEIEQKISESTKIVSARDKFMNECKTSNASKSVWTPYLSKEIMEMVETSKCVQEKIDHLEEEEYDPSMTPRPRP